MLCMSVQERRAYGTGCTCVDSMPHALSMLQREAERTEHEKVMKEVMGAAWGPIVNMLSMEELGGITYLPATGAKDE